MRLSITGEIISVSNKSKMNYEPAISVKTTDLYLSPVLVIILNGRELKKLKTKVGNLMKLKMGKNLLENCIIVKKLLFIVVILVLKKQL